MSSQIAIKFGGNIKKYRLIRGFSQEELADRAGMHRTYIGMIERAEKNISIDSADRIAKALEVELGELLK